MAVFEKWFEQDLHKELVTQHCEAIVLTGDNLSNLIGVRLYEDGEPAAPTGVVTLRAIRADGTTVVDNDGVLSGNAASIVLKESCMAVPGPLVLQLRVTNGDVRTTVLRAVFTVDISETGVIIDPGRVIPDIETLLAMLAEMEEAKDAANQAAEDAETSAAAADTATTGANAAANAANTAAASVDAAKAAAQAAATAANAAATAANTATTEANAARDYAYDAGEGAGAAARDAYSASAEAYAATDGANAAANAANTAASTANAAAENADEATDDANQAVDDLRHFMEQVTPADTATGRVVTFEPTTEGPFIGLEVFGRCEQDGTPTPTSPKDIAVAGDGGTLKMSTVSKNLAHMERGTLNASGAEAASTTAWRTGYLPIMGACVYASKDYNFSDSALNMTAHFYGAGLAHLGSAVVMDYNVLQQATALSTVAAAAGAIFVRFVQDFPSTSSRPEMFSVMVTFGASGEQFPEFSLADGSRASLLIPSGAGLRGLPVEETDSWNYQDTEGQYWVCDVASYSDGVCTRRVGKTTFANLTGLQYDASTGIFKTTSPIPTALFENHIMTRIYESVDNDSSVPPTLADGQICPINAGPHVQWKDSRFTSVEDMLAAIGDEPIYYMLRASSVAYMTDEQKNSFNALRSCNGITHVFAEDAARPYFTASVYSNFLEHLDDTVEEAVQIAVSEAVEPIHDEVENIGERVDDLESYVRDMSPVAAVGPADMVSIDDAAPLTVEGLMVNVEPVQDLHGYENPWPAGGGKNLANPARRTNLAANIQLYYDATGFLLKANTAYTLSWSTASAQTSVDDVDGNRLTTNYGKTSITYTPTADVYAKFDIFFNSGFPAPSGGTADVLVQLELGSAATSFAPYSNLCPITGWDGVTVTDVGKNLFDKAAITPNSWIVANTTTIETAQNFFVTDYIPVEVGKPIVCTSRGASRSIYYDKAKNPITYFSWSSEILNPQYDGYIRVTDTNTNLDTLQIELGSTATSYEPYKSRTASVDFPSTVYGGTVDLVKGECVITKKSYNAADLAGWRLADSSSSETHKVWRTADSAFSGEISKAASWGMCSKYKEAFGVLPINMPESSFVTNGSGVLYVCDSRFSTLDAFLASYGDCQFVFDLAEPITIALTPAELELFKGINNVSADAGQVTVMYRQDVFLALNKRINELQALVLES